MDWNPARGSGRHRKTIKVKPHYKLKFSTVSGGWHYFAGGSPVGVESRRLFVERKTFLVTWYLLLVTMLSPPFLRYAYLAFVDPECFWSVVGVELAVDDAAIQVRKPLARACSDAVRSST